VGAAPASYPAPPQGGQPRLAGERAKVAGRSCLVGGGRPVDPAHLVPRSPGGCHEPDCVVSLDRRCHRAYDRGELDLLPYLEPGCRAELAHALTHLSLLSLLCLVTGTRWRPDITDVANTEGRA
jgi:hypothetical protein